MAGTAIRDILIGLLLGYSGMADAAARSPDAAETIVIRVRPPYSVCAGACPWFEAHVGPGNTVISRLLGLGSGDRIEARRTYRFHVSAARLGAFRNLLLPLRPPVGERHADQVCVPAMRDGAPDPLDDPRPDDIDIGWASGHQSARFTACGRNPAVSGRLTQALRALGLYPTGDRI